MVDPHTSRNLHDTAGRPIAPALQELCRAIHELPALGVIQATVAPAPRERWSVFIRCLGLPTLEGYASLEFLVWLQREARAAGFSDLFVGVGAPPPYLNGICRSLYFFIQGRAGQPDELAHFIRRYRTLLFALPHEGVQEVLSRA